jgi:hypothetical protein
MKKIHDYTEWRSYVENYAQLHTQAGWFLSAFLQNEGTVNFVSQTAFRQTLNPEQEWEWEDTYGKGISAKI